ncbi:amidohydrolase [Babesia caballi]|uniref:Amidohydrolase n=1 Tax=Babesia caballi TaxID=5871 RepID=A0AAV4M4T1_BABCB|nr:amidohydrolase [Babesia caballi]
MRACEPVSENCGDSPTNEPADEGIIVDSVRELAPVAELPLDSIDKLSTCISRLPLPLDDVPSCVLMLGTPVSASSPRPSTGGCPGMIRGPAYRNPRISSIFAIRLEEGVLEFRT